MRIQFWRTALVFLPIGIVIFYFKKIKKNVDLWIFRRQLIHSKRIDIKVRERDMKLRHLALLFLGLFFQLSHGLTWSDVIELRDEAGIIEVTEDNYEFLGKGSRDFYSVLFITSSKPNSKGQVCDMCTGFLPNMRKTSAAIIAQVPTEVSNEVFFFEVDVSRNPTFLKEFKVKNIPHLLIYPPSPEDDSFAWKSNDFYQYPINERSIEDAVHFADFLAKILNVYIEVTPDFQYNDFFRNFFVCVTVFMVFKKKVLPRINHKARFFTMVLSFLVLFLSITGYKFTTIRNIPFIARNDQGEIMYFSGNMNWQFGIEVFTVSAMYILMSACCIGLILLPKFQRLRLKHKNFCSVILLCLLFYVYAYFLDCFTIKEPGYPYHLW